MFSHTCIKPSCGKKYQDEEVDAFYCPECDELRKTAAKEMDAKFNTANQQPSGGFSAYEAARGTHKFPRAADLGIKI